MPPEEETGLALSTIKAIEIIQDQIFGLGSIDVQPQHLRPIIRPIVLEGYTYNLGTKELELAKVPRRNEEWLLSALLGEAREYAYSNATPEGVYNFLKGLSRVLKRAQESKPPIDVFSRFRPQIVGSVSMIAYEGLREARKYITSDGEGWERKALNEISLVDGVLQTFGADIKEGVIGRELFGVVQYFVTSCRTRAEEFSKKGNYTGMQRLKEAAQLLTEAYGMPIPLGF